MFRYIFILAISFWAQISFAQVNLNGALYVLNEGGSQQKGTLGKISFPGGFYTHLDSIDAYGNDVLVDGNRLFAVDGSGNVLNYDLAPFSLVKEIQNVSARQIKLFGNQLVMSCSDEPYFKVYDLVGDSLLYSLDTNSVNDIAEGLWIENQKAYLLVNGFGSSNELKIIDLLTGTLIKTIQTSPNPNDFIKSGNSLFFNCPQYVDSVFYIQELDLATDNIVQTRTFNGVISYGGIAAKDTKILFNNNTNYPASISAWDYSTDVLDTNFKAVNAYALGYYATDDLLVYSETDYVSTGSITFVQNPTATNPLSQTVNTHISPRRFFWVPDSPSSRNSILMHQISVYPNPAKDKIFVQSEVEILSLELQNLEGKQVFQGESKQIDVSHLPSGFYILSVQTKEGTQNFKIVIE